MYGESYLDIERSHNYKRASGLTLKKSAFILLFHIQLSNKSLIKSIKFSKRLLRT